jgi:peptidoglycan L-alanyl-D-glutamate endopeptidase CwlK
MKRANIYKSREPQWLDERMCKRFYDFIHICRALYSRDILKQIPFLTCTFRSNPAQADLYASGRAKPGPIRTRAKPGKSKHNIKINGVPASMAFDLAFRPAGKPRGCTYVGQWKLLGQIADLVGLKWAGNWKHPDKPHFYL